MNGPSRRALLSAIAIAPLAGAVIAPAVASASTIEWGAAVRAQLAARAAMDKAYAEKVKPVTLAQIRGEATHEEVCEAEEAWGHFADAHADAVYAMTVTPAPSLAALAYKIDTAQKDWLFDSSSAAGDAIDAILADVRRLGGIA